MKKYMTNENFLGTREFVTYALKHVSGRVLDLGAGTAKYKPLICQKSSTYTAFDLFPGKNIDVVGDILHTGFLDASFDTVFCTQVFEHIPKPWLAVLEIKRILTEGGVVVVTAPFLQASHADPHDYFRYTIEGMKSLFEGEGFQVLDSGSYGYTGFVLLDFIKLRWWNPYLPSNRFTPIVTRLISRFGHFLDTIFHNKIMYGNTYVIVKKV